MENFSAEGGADQGIMSLFLTNGKFRNVVIRGLGLANAKTPMIDTRCGSIGEVWLINCPKVKFFVQGKPGSIGTIHVVGSPGCVIQNNPVDGQIPAPSVVYEPSTCPVCGKPVVP